jgi:hypothetical protein
VPARLQRGSAPVLAGNAYEAAGKALDSPTRRYGTGSQPKMRAHGEGDDRRLIGGYVGDYAVYRRVDFGPGMDTVRFEGRFGGAQIDLRLDAPDGPLLAALRPPKRAGDLGADFPMEGARGVRDVYLVRAGGDDFSGRRLIFSGGGREVARPAGAFDGVGDLATWGVARRVALRPLYPCLEVRVAAGGRAEASAPVLNAGTAPTGWTAQSDAPWLAARVDGAAELGPESPDGRIALAVDASGLRAGVHEGQIAIEAGASRARIGIRVVVE